MYKLKENIEQKELQKYGFKPGKEYPENDEFICNDNEKDLLWLLPKNPDDPENIWMTEENMPVWSILIQENRTLWIDFVPYGTFHIGNCDAEEMFYVLMRMIQDGILEDDFNPNNQ